MSHFKLGRGVAVRLSAAENPDGVMAASVGSSGERISPQNLYKHLFFLHRWGPLAAHGTFLQMKHMLGSCRVKNVTNKTDQGCLEIRFGIYRSEWCGRAPQEPPRRGRTRLLLCLFTFSLSPLSTSSTYPSGGVQLLPGHAVAAGARRAVCGCGFLRRRIWEGARVGARRRAVRRQPLFPTAAAGAQDQVGHGVAWIGPQRATSPPSNGPLG